MAWRRSRAHNLVLGVVANLVQHVYNITDCSLPDFHQCNSVQTQQSIGHYSRPLSLSWTIHYFPYGCLIIIELSLLSKDAHPSTVSTDQGLSPRDLPS